MPKIPSFLRTIPRLLPFPAVPERCPGSSLRTSPSSHLGKHEGWRLLSQDMLSSLLVFKGNVAHPQLQVGTQSLQKSSAPDHSPSADSLGSHLTASLF